ncbi:MAG: ASCH domain-containing protein [Methylobacter sp.]
MLNAISEQIRQRVIEIAAQYGFAVQLKDNGQDQYVKNLMFYSKSLNQTIYVRKDRAVDGSGNPAYFHVAVHPSFFNKAWVSVTEGIEELINRQNHKNLHSSSNYQKFPVFPENDEPCGICFKVIGYEALGKLFQQMATAGNKKAHSSSELISPQKLQTETSYALDNKPIYHEGLSTVSKLSKPINKVPTKGLVIKSPYIDRILAGTKTWEMRSSTTSVRGPIALIKQGSGQVVGIANLADVKGPLSKQDKLKFIDKHQISLDQLESGETDKWDTVWVLEDAQPLIIPVRYQHPNGAVIWVKLDHEVQGKLALAIKQMPVLS